MSLEQTVEKLSAMKFRGMVSALEDWQQNGARQNLDPADLVALLAVARHYGTCVIPARPHKPRDKAKVEVGVQIAQRWIIAALRDRTFYSIAEINRAIRELLEKLNNRPMRKLKRSRTLTFH